tara:strand:+ start:266 stop:904 length:639 start_codon:yes stop_codon:yes gene_type:complete
MRALNNSVFRKTLIIPVSILFCFCENSFLDFTLDEFFITNTFLLSNNPKLNYDSKGVLNYENIPFSGFLIKKSRDGQLIEKKGFYRGHIEGKSVGYFENGNKKYKRYYKDGKKTGKHIGWYISGQIKFKYFFKEGLSEKKHTQWYDNGMIHSEINYLDGKPFGSTKVWRKDGKLRSNYVIRENGRRYGLAGIKRCTKIDVNNEIIEPYTVLK